MTCAFTDAHVCMLTPPVELLVSVKAQA